MAWRSYDSFSVTPGQTIHGEPTWAVGMRRRPDRGQIKLAAAIPPTALLVDCFGAGRRGPRPGAVAKDGTVYFAESGGKDTFGQPLGGSIRKISGGILSTLARDISVSGITLNGAGVLYASIPGITKS